MRRIAVFGVLLGVAAFLAVASRGSITSVSGQVVQIAPPPSVQFGALQSNDHMFAFDERQNVTLAAALPVDISQPGQYGPNCNCDPLTPGTIPAGTTVSSQFIHTDAVGGSNPPKVLDATVVTSTPIIGIEVCGPARQEVCGGNHGLDATDAVLGNPTTSYPTGVFGRSMNFNKQNEYLIWMVDNHTVQIQTATTSDVDQVRIITAGATATIVVKKLTVPSGSTQSFPFTGDLAGSIQDQGTISKTVGPGTYQTTENVPDGWALSNISCDDQGSSGNTATGTATYQVSAGQTVTCTYTDSVVFAGGGNFVVGDLTVGPMSQAIGKSVNFWGSQWWKNNSLTGGTGPAAFKGFEDSLATPACGVNWTSRPGNSSNPPSTIPQYMGIIVSSNVTKSGSAISGDTPHIVIVKTDSGYGPNPGHPGTGTITSVVC